MEEPAVPRTRAEPRYPKPYVMLNGGVEGYTGDLAPALDPGFSYGATIGVRPLRYLGVELGYSGSVTELEVPFSDIGAGTGADVVRNGGQAAVVAGLGTRIEPYVLGGFGVENYNVRNGQVFGFDDDTHAYVPAGVGVRMNVTRNITADARGTYNFLISDEFAPISDASAWNGRYLGTLSIGGTF